jgi:hypothetical protein
LARFAYEREDAKPKWPSFLSINIKSFMKRSGAWLTAHRAFCLADRPATSRPSSKADSVYAAVLKVILAVKPRE